MNILHIHSHDTGKLISPYGYNLPTPNLEQLAQEMIVFDNYYTVSPTCTPSRSATLTGLMPASNGLIGLAHRGFELERKDMHLANVLKNCGYQTVLSGIQHEIGKYDQINNNVSEQLGYQLNITSLHKCGEEQWDRDNLKATKQFLNEYTNEQPFYISHGTFATHRPYYEDNSISKNTYYRIGKLSNNDIENDDRNYHYTVKVFDDIVGELVDSLKNNDLYDNTIIIISTDHGIANPECKCNLNDLGTNIMLMMHIPGYENLKATVNKSLLANIDLVPTLYDILGIEVSEKLDGKSFKPVLDGEVKEINEQIFFELNYHTSHEPAISIRTKYERLTIFLDHEYQYLNWSNIDNSPQKDQFYSWFKNSKKVSSYFEDYRTQSKIIKTDDEQRKKQLEQKLIYWNQNRYKIKVNKLNFSINNKTDYNPSIGKG